jgi:sarcosine oxidase delta subunit
MQLLASHKGLIFQGASYVFQYVTGLSNTETALGELTETWSSHGDGCQEWHVLECDTV